MVLWTLTKGHELQHVEVALTAIIVPNQFACKLIFSGDGGVSLYVHMLVPPNFPVLKGKREENKRKEKRLSPHLRAANALYS